MNVGDVYYVVEQGIWNPREQRFEWRPWHIAEDRADAIREAHRVAVHRVSRCEVIRQSPLANPQKQQG